MKHEIQNGQDRTGKYSLRVILDARNYKRASLIQDSSHPHINLKTGLRGVSQSRRETMYITSS
jgi:hypothetical protein